MLARNASGLYWIGRYLERARHGCRLLRDQLATMEDRPVEQIADSWRRLYMAAGRSPVGGHMESTGDEEDFMAADAYTLADDLTFAHHNPDSIRNCVAAARENARQIRNVIGSDMWSCLNVTHLDLRDVEIQAIWAAQPGDFFARAEDSIRAFWGIAESAMYRDGGWHFLVLGRFLERAQLLGALVEAHIAVFPSSRRDSEWEWRSLLAVCEAHFAYRHLYPLEHRPDRILDFLVADARLAHSLRHSLLMIAESLKGVSGSQARQAEVARRVRRMAGWIDGDWPRREPNDDEAACAALARLRQSCRQLHEDIAAAFFSSEIQDQGGRT